MYNSPNRTTEPGLVTDVFEKIDPDFYIHLILLKIINAPEASIDRFVLYVHMLESLLRAKGTVTTAIDEKLNEMTKRHTEKYFQAAAKLEILTKLVFDSVPDETDVKV